MKAREDGRKAKIRLRRIVQFLGYQGSGKTTAIECVIRNLEERGRRVAAVKHIHEPGFSIDKPGKDTWRFLESHASVVISLAKNEVALITRGDTTGTDLSQLERMVEPHDVEYLLIEGRHELSRSSDPRLRRVICARTRLEVDALLREHPSTACITGAFASTSGLTIFRDIPVFMIPRDLDELLRLLEPSQ